LIIHLSNLGIRSGGSRLKKGNIRRDMAKIRRIAPTKIKKITGGKDPSLIVEKFMIRRGFDPEQCLHQKTSDISQWLVPHGDEEELEITLEGLSRSPETTLYMGLNILSVPIQGTQDFLVAVLSVADTLIGAKLSVVNYDLVLSVTNYTANMRIDDIDYYYELIIRQRDAVIDAIHEELS